MAPIMSSMARKSFTPLIKTTLETYPALKDNYKKLAQKVGCCTKTIKRYFENLDSKVQHDKTQSHKFIPPQENDTYIDDPDELLMSVAIRELNKPAPDPRWASILINCKKENIAQKDEVIEQLQKLPTRNITEILKKQHIKSWQDE